MDAHIANIEEGGNIIFRFPSFFGKEGTGCLLGLETNQVCVHDQRDEKELGAYWAWQPIQCAYRKDKEQR